MYTAVEGMLVTVRSKFAETQAPVLNRTLLRLAWTSVARILLLPINVMTHSGGEHIQSRRGTRC